MWEPKPAIRSSKSRTAAAIPVGIVIGAHLSHPLQHPCFDSATLCAAQGEPSRGSFNLAAMVPRSAVQSSVTKGMGPRPWDSPASDRPASASAGSSAWRAADWSPSLEYADASRAANQGRSPGETFGGIRLFRVEKMDGQLSRRAGFPPVGSCLRSDTPEARGSQPASPEDTAMW